MAFQIIRHAFRMIFGNFEQALRVSVGPYLLLIFAFIVVAGVVAPQAAFLDDPASGLPAGIGPLGLLVMIAMVIFALFVFGWVAVSWHRFILLEEYSGALPAIAGRPVWPYVGRSILYGFLVGLAAIPIFFVIGLVASPFIGSNPEASPPITALAVFVLASAVLTFIWFRIGLALPGIAVGKPISLGQAWSATSGKSGMILGVAVLLMAINGVAGIAVGFVAQILPIIGFVLNLFVQWVTFMLGISILTTFYGHLIENRPLVD